MSDALRLGRPALIQAIERALDGIDENVTADFDKQDEQWQKKYDELSADARETQNRLESEIGLLRNKVASLTSSLERREAASRPTDTADAAGGTDTREPDTGTVASDGAGGDTPRDGDKMDEKLADSVSELQQSLEKSQVRYEAVRDQLDAAVALVRKRKAETLSWVKYADSLELKIKRLEKRKTGSRQSATAAALPSTAPAAHRTTLTPSIPLTPATPENLHVEVLKPSLSTSFSSPAVTSFLGNPTADDEGREPELPLRKATGVDDVDIGDASRINEPALDSTQGEPSSDTSQPELPDLPTPRATNSDEVGGRVMIKSEPSSDGPEVIWERAAKKPKRNEQQGGRDRGTAAPQTPQVKPPMKRESSGDTPWTGLAHYRGSQESIDLDEGQLTVQTPRKRHLFYNQQRSLSERESEESSENASQEKAAVDPALKQAGPLPLPFQRPLRPHPPPPLAPATPLAPVSVNVRRGIKDPAKALKQLKRGIESLAEDNQGSDFLSGAQKRTAMEPPSTTKSSRLSALLNSRPSEPSPVSSLPRTTTLSVQRNHNTDSPIAGIFGRPPPTRMLPHLRDSETSSSLPGTPNPTVRGNAAHTPHAAHKAHSPATPATPAGTATPTPTTNPLIAALMAAKAESAAKKASSPLRGRPVHQLMMDDFKINPALNNGETFAYNEVVRSRTDRANLAGCTDPQCCGKAFRGMATSELDAAGPPHIRRPDSVVLMERHLGDDAFVLATMSPGEKRELWIEARTKELADKYGKHRHRYHRRASPPGFWDTDFPTTQEEAQNRAEAERVERVTVQERYREAMRPGGGRWLFRDE